MEEKEISFETIPINLLKKEHKDAEYLKFSPNGKVPCLVDSGELSINNSTAAALYIESIHPTPVLLGNNAAERAKIMEAFATITEDTQPIQNISVLGYISDKGVDRTEFARHWIESGLTTFMEVTKCTRGRFSFGDSLTYADMCLIPQLYNARRFDVDFSKFSVLESIWKECESLDSYQKSRPDNQPDAVKN